MLFCFGAYSHSTDGLLSSNQGSSDIWVSRLNAGNPRVDRSGARHHLHRHADHPDEQLYGRGGYTLMG